MATNPELELAFRYVSQTNRHVYLTGKAGTGKTTFLHRVRAEVPKRMAVVAPTGVAAINAKGITIHSLFQLPFGVLLPGSATKNSRQFSAKKLDLIRGLDLLVIDEISMVRADVLDGIDEVLRRLRRNQQPFGGLQLLMIGDLHQLPPVVKDSDWYQMRDHYDTAYFFGSKALRNARPATIQLKHIYRQQDDVFIGLLNKVRNNQMDADVLATLNQRYQAGFNPGDDEGYITLTSHNNAAYRINQEKIGQLTTPAHKFSAEVSGKFPESMYPNNPKLEFKVGAQVMFNKNDTMNKLYFNGKIGRVTRIKDDRIWVECPGDDEAIYVDPVTWENRKIELNPETKLVEDHIIGEYTQHPLKLAWAITIHKSQGLTFDKVVIDAADAFAHGQVYVALSRCKTFEGIVLRSRIGDRSVRTDAVVAGYSEKAENNQPTEEDLLADKRRFQLDGLRRLFQGTALSGTADRLKRALLENERWLTGGATLEYTPIHGELRAKVLEVGKKFIPHINKYGLDEAMPENNPDLSERLGGAADYFLRELEAVANVVHGLEIQSDNQKIQRDVVERYEAFKRELFVTTQLFNVLKAGYEPHAFVQARANAAIDYGQANKAAKKRSKATTPKDLNHPALYRALYQWRADYAAEKELRPSSVIPTKALLEIDLVLPTTKKSLLRVKGYGAKRFESSGAEILAVINGYLAGKDLKTDNLEFAQGAQAKEDTRAITLKLYEQGQTVAEIAAARNLAENTIQGHLAHWIKLGDVAASDFLDEETISTIVNFVNAHPTEILGDIRTGLEEKYGYGEIKIALAHREFAAAMAAPVE